MKKLVSLLMVPVFVVGMSASCTPQKVETAKAVFAKVAFYVSLAQSLIKVAETNYQSNEKVATALAATRTSLQTVETLLASLEAGLEKDEGKLSTALVALVSDVFALMSAIKAAKEASKATP